MRMDMKREAELAKRKGATVRTIVAVIWLGLCFGFAYLVSGWLFDTGTLSIDFFYNSLFVPRTIDENVVRAGFMVLIVIVLQFFVLLGYAFGSPAGRYRPGTPSALSREPDPTEGRYNYR